jgi:Thioredoxin like C-terminal domain
VVEHRLAKARVASSNLVSRSKPPSRRMPDLATAVSEQFNYNFEGCPAKARYPSGKGEVCKTFMRRFDPGPRLQYFYNLQENLPKAIASLWGLLGDYLHYHPSSPVNRTMRSSTRTTDADQGIDVDEQGIGVATEPRLYQLIRQQNLVVDRRFEIEFLDLGIAAFSFTSG